MPALAIGGVTVRATSFRRLPDETGGGGLRRTVNGDLRGRSDWVKAAWVATLLVLDDAELATLRGEADIDVDEVISGDLIGTPVTCRVQLGDVEAVRDRDSWVYAVAVTLREV